jgi:AcrR family transcriptional regulator
VQLTVALARQLPPLAADASMLREAVLSIVLDAIENAAPEISASPVRVDTKLLDDLQIELAVTHRRRPETTEDDAWALRVARSVAEAHGATVAVETTATSETLVRTLWPTGPSFISGPAAM